MTATTSLRMPLLLLVLAASLLLAVAAAQHASSHAGPSSIPVADGADGSAKGGRIIQDNLAVL